MGAEEDVWRGVIPPELLSHLGKVIHFLTHPLFSLPK